ncbi:MAG: sugar ABC transporter ATP-binding protein [Kiritimatiellia bacterium]|jgi:ribose transport system ATP-binding protein
MEHALEISHVTKSFGSVQVLNGISLALGRGRMLGLAGGNGAGKSTLAKCIAGHLRPDGGDIRAAGEVAMVPQEFMLVPEMRVYENVFLGRELRRRNRLVDRQAMIRQCADALARLDADIDPEAFVADLGVAGRQKVELAKAVLFSSAVLILDEPTTVLNANEAETLFGILRAFRDAGGAVVFVSHRLQELTAHCDEIAVMRDGDLVFHGPAAGLAPKDVAEMMVGQSLDSLFPALAPPPQDAPVALEVEHLGDGRAVRDVSFSLRQGEILGLAGLAGAGRTELAETLCGVRRRATGAVRIHGQKADIRSMHDALAAGIVYLPEDRQGAALLLDDSVAANTVLASLRRYAPRGFIRRRPCERAARGYVERFRIRAESIRAPIRTLSGGNQQKVAIAKGLDTHPRIFIFDEPTRGVDVGARAEIYGFIHALAAEGVACLLIASDLDEILGNCTRTLVMRAGAIAGELDRPAMSEAQIMYLATGVN